MKIWYRLQKTIFNYHFFLNLFHFKRKDIIKATLCIEVVVPVHPIQFFFLFISDTPFFTAYLSNKFATFVPRIIRRCRGRVTSGTNSWYCRANDIVTVTHNLHGVIARAPARPLAKNYSERLETIDDLSSPPPLPSRLLLLCLRGVRVISVAYETGEPIWMNVRSRGPFRGCSRDGHVR